MIDESEVVYHVQSVPHDWLFPRVDAVCHHGGAGTTGASLRGMLFLTRGAPCPLPTMDPCCNRN